MAELHRFIMFKDGRSIFHCPWISDLKRQMDDMNLPGYDFDIVAEHLILNHGYQLLDFEGNEVLHILVIS